MNAMNGLKLVEEQFLLIKGVAGIANRILCILGGIVYAQLTDRKLIIDWRDQAYSDDGENIFSKLFELSNINQSIEIPKTDSVYPPIWKNNLHKTVDQVLEVDGFSGERMKVLRFLPLIKYKYRINIRNLNYQEQVVVRWSNSSEIEKIQHYLPKESSELKFCKEKELLKRLMKKHIKLNENIQKQINYFKKENFSDINIGIHIRYTDRKNPFDKYYKIIDEIIEELKTDCRIFLATDNEHVELKFKDKYKDKVIATEKWYPKDTSFLDRLHFHPDCPDKLQNAIEALIDLYLLGSCNYLICDQTSSFALLAELISNAPKANIFDTSQQRFKTKLKKIVRPIIEVT